MSNIQESIYGNVKVIRNSDYKWGVTDLNGNVIVPFGKYGWIDGFDSGLARVRDHKQPFYPNNTILIMGLNETIRGKENVEAEFKRRKKENPDAFAKWGIINEKGEEVLPVIYDSVRKFLGKNKISTKITKGDIKSEVYFHTLNPDLPKIGLRSLDNDEDQYGRNFGEFAGSYAQDVMGYSDDVINDAFEGDPDNYWNID